VSVRWYAAVVDCHDARAQSRWWAHVLGWHVADEDDDGTVTVLPPHLADTTRKIPPAERCPSLMFQPLPAGEQLKNRLHIDLAPPADSDQQAEIRRLEELGAELIAVGEGDVDWVIMKDPEGNSFCVLSPRD
jgi:hypothetical protein